MTRSTFRHDTIHIQTRHHLHSGTTPSTARKSRCGSTDANLRNLPSKINTRQRPTTTNIGVIFPPSLRSGVPLATLAACLRAPKAYGLQSLRAPKPTGSKGLRTPKPTGSNGLRAPMCPPCRGLRVVARLLSPPLPPLSARRARRTAPHALRVVRFGPLAFREGSRARSAGAALAGISPWVFPARYARGVARYAREVPPSSVRARAPARPPCGCGCYRLPLPLVLFIT